MKVILGSDHRGFTLKQTVKKYLLDHDFAVQDVGDLLPTTPDDYPDIAASAAKEVLADTENKGIIFCGSGVGILIAANKISGIRCGFGYSPEQVAASRADDDINMVAFASDFTPQSEVTEMVDAFLTTNFVPSENHTRRLKKIAAIEKKDNESIS